MAKPKKWVAIRYSLPKAERSSAYKKIFGFKWTERKDVHDLRLRRMKSRYVRTVKGERQATGIVLESQHANLAHSAYREYRREIPSDLKGVPYSKLGRGVILVPPSHVDKAVDILKSRGCAVDVAGPVIPSQGQYQASNAYFLGQWQSYLSAFDGLLSNVVDDATAKMSLEAAYRLSEQFLIDVKSLPVATVPEDLEALSLKPKVTETLNAYSSNSDNRALLLANLRRDVQVQLKVLREQGQAVLAAL